MIPTPRLVRGAALAAFVCLVLPLAALSETITATQKQGSMHGFLALRSSDGKLLAIGDQISVCHDDLVTSRLVLHFRDGSIDDERTVFRQRHILELVSDHHVQKGPSFPQPLDLAVDVPKGEVTYRETKDGKEEVKTEHMDLPPDLANGLVSQVLQNLPAKTQEFKVSYIAASPKPRIVKLAIKPDGEDRFHILGAPRTALRYRIHIDLGGIAGVVAPVIGKEPSDIEAWVLRGEVPAFLKMDGALYMQGPIWSMQLVSPEWPSTHH